MQINTRRYDRYLNIEIEIDNTKHDLGFHGVDEIRTMMEVLRDASDEMKDDIEHIEKFYSENVKMWHGVSEGRANGVVHDRLVRFHRSFEST